MLDATRDHFGGGVRKITLSQPVFLPYGVHVLEPIVYEY